VAYQFEQNQLGWAKLRQPGICVIAGGNCLLEKFLLQIQNLGLEIPLLGEFRSRIVYHNLLC